MGLWLWDADPKFSFSLADELTELRVALILRGAWDEDAADHCCDGSDQAELGRLIDLAAERAARAAH